MRMTTSFTGSRGVRYPAPDVARGFMLLLIAVANVPSWNKMPNGAEPPVSSVDAWWMFVRTLVVDHRAYPLFAMLFGFGLMTMINRRIASGTQSYLASLPGAQEGREPMPHEAAWAREMATIDAYRLVRRRGWWMLLFGFIHGLVFPGDIIGAYGLVAVLLANLLARKNYAALYLTAGIIAVVALGTYLATGTLSAGAGVPESGEQSVSLGAALLWVGGNILQWFVVLIVQVLIALIIPAAILGARLADTDLLTQPERHRRLRLAGTAGAVRRGSQAGRPADGAALDGLRRRPPVHDRLPEPDDHVRLHLRRHSAPGDGPAHVGGAGHGRPHRAGRLADNRGLVRPAGARRPRRSLRDPAAHRCRPQRAQEDAAAAPARRLARDAAGRMADDADGGPAGCAGADAAGCAAGGSARGPAGCAAGGSAWSPAGHAGGGASRSPAGIAADRLSRRHPCPSTGRMAGQEAPPFGGDDLGA